MSFSLLTFLPTANRWSIPRIHSQLDHAHMHGRARWPVSVSQSRAAEIANICLENECAALEVKQLRGARLWAHLVKYGPPRT